MKVIGIISALDQEVELLKKHLKEITSEKIGKHEFYTGKRDGKTVIFSVCGVGKVNAAVATQMLISEYDPDLIINTGIAGSLDDRLNVMDLVIGKDLKYHDFDEKIMKLFFPHVTKFRSDKDLVKLAEELNPDGISGTIVTGDQFINTKNKKNELKSRFNALCCEMEGAAIAHAAFTNDVPFIVLRTISDMADDDADEVYENFEAIAAEKACGITLEMIDRL